MPPKKNGKSVRAIKDEESGIVALHTVGALPPSPDEEGRVEHDLDVMSEAPDPEDTSRAEEVPSLCEKNKHLIGCALLAFFFGTTTVVLSTLLFTASHPECTGLEFFDMFNNTTRTHCI